MCPPQVVTALSVLKFTEVRREGDEDGGGAQRRGGKKKGPAGAKRERTQIDEEVGGLRRWGEGCDGGL